MTVKWVTNGKLRVQVGELNDREWMEWLEKSNANGVAKITSINHRAAQHARWKGQGIAWDRSEPGTLCSIIRSTREVVVSKLRPPT
jgi:hypothetical protein